MQVDRSRTTALPPIGMMLLDSHGRVVDGSAGIFRIFGLARAHGALSDLVACADPRSGAHLSDSEVPWQRALAGATVEDVQVLLPRVKRTVAVSARPQRLPGTTEMGAVIIVSAKSNGLETNGRPHLPRYLLNVLELLARGLGTAEIAAELHVTVGTTRLYVKRLYAHLGVNSRTQAVLRAADLGLISL